MVPYVAENRLRGRERRYVAGERAENETHKCGISFDSIHTMDILIDHGFDVVD